MQRTLLAAIALVLIAQQATAQPQLDVLDTQMRLCKFLMERNVSEGRECIADVRQRLAREKNRLLIQSGRAEVARAFLAKHGINEPDIDAKFQVAKRRGVLFAVILSECWTAHGDVAAMEYCLDQREKAEVMLGNDLSQP